MIPSLKTVWAFLPEFFARLDDRDVMRIAALLARKSYDEGGCPIGAVIVDDATRQIVGKGHNTLVQENHPYNHGEVLRPERIRSI